MNGTRKIYLFCIIREFFRNRELDIESYKAVSNHFWRKHLAVSQAETMLSLVLTDLQISLGQDQDVRGLNHYSYHRHHNHSTYSQAVDFQSAFTRRRQNQHDRQHAQSKRRRLDDASAYYIPLDLKPFE